LREDDQFDARRTDPRELYEKHGFFGDPKRKFRLFVVCLLVGVGLAAASGRSGLPNWLMDALIAGGAFFVVLGLFLLRWSAEYWTLNKSVAKDRPSLWRWRG